MKAGDLIKVLKEANQTVPPELPPMLSAMGGFKGQSRPYSNSSRTYANYGTKRTQNRSSRLF
jgi:hypothetical protein